MKEVDPNDPKGLIREAYKIEGITDAECRSILVDWALSLPAGADTVAALKALEAKYAVPDHPMSRLIADGQQMPSGGRRRGGRRRTAET